VLYNPTTGNRVSGFGTDGKRKVDLFGQFDVGWGVAVDSAGRIILGGTTDVGFNDSIAAVRLNATNAALDTSFGGDGIVIAASGDRVGSNAEGGGVFHRGQRRHDRRRMALERGHAVTRAPKHRRALHLERYAGQQLRPRRRRRVPRRRNNRRHRPGAGRRHRLRAAISPSRPASASRA
jgi:hypothetical protein